MIECSLCREKISPKTYPDHRSDYCIELQMSCRRCDRTVTPRTYSAHHLLQCPKSDYRRTVRAWLHLAGCELCGDEVQDSELPAHLTGCLLCPHCERPFSRLDYEHHRKFNCRRQVVETSDVQGKSHSERWPPFDQREAAMTMLSQVAGGKGKRPGRDCTGALYRRE